MTVASKRQLVKGLALPLIGIVVWTAFPLMKVLFWGLPLCIREAPTRLPVPVVGIRPEQVGDTFGAPRARGRRHEGVDIFAPRHTKVICPIEGVVLWIGENQLGGRTVRVIGPGGERHYFAHLEAYGDVFMGKRIPAGFVLGTVGDSGNARGTPPHLHYGIYGFPCGALNPRIRLGGFGRR